MLVAFLSRLTAFIVFMILFMFFWIFIDDYFKLGITEGDNIKIFMEPFFLMTYLLFVFPNLRKDFLSRLVLAERYKVYCYPLLAAILCAFVINLIRLIPMLWGEDIIGVGSQQYQNDGTLSELGELVLVTLFPGFTEELFVHYLPYGGLYLIIERMSRDEANPRFRRLKSMLLHMGDELFHKKNKMYIAWWVVIIAALFSLMHGPSAESFILYFLSGLVNGIFFVRYGFIAAWMSHSGFNLFSGMAWAIINAVLLS